jgi:SERRATE/Ars2, N-terminal domain
MFDHHRKSPWFAEKYDPAPEFQALRTRVRKEGWKGRIDGFLLDLESGKFDPDLNEPELEPSSPVKENAAIVDASTANDADGMTTRAEETKASGGDDEMQFTMDAEEDAGDHDTVRTEANGRPALDKRSNRGEEISVLPEGNQVMIRTIPPDIGRVKLEEVGFRDFFLTFAF